MNTSKFIGSTLILIGTAVGAGMLAMPAVSASAGFILSATMILILWAASTITGLLVIEVTLALPSQACSFNAMSTQTLGIFGKVITWASYLFLLYAIMITYIMGGSSIVAGIVNSIFNVEIPNWISAVLFTMILGVAVFWSTKAVDYLNRNLMSLKGLSLIVALSLIAPQIEINKLITIQGISHAKYILAAIPVFLAAFSYHFIIPSLRIYVGDKPRQLKMIVIIGNTFAMLIYLWWLACVFGIIPLTGDNSFTSIASDPHPPRQLIQLITSIANNKWITSSINSFATIALTTSFLGVALGLFDFLAEGFKRKDTRFGRLQTSGLTFIPPVIFALFFPGGFVKALNYASIAVAILAFILPALMAYYLRKHSTLKSPYRVKCGNIGLALIVLIGSTSIVLALMYAFNLLPTLK
ncbi:MAG: tyrosine-specific transport protein [Gammaproteobacteria bacterium]|nr:tyrosine-specific transport protein [Gammaproteobacteria bacterium]